MNIISTGTGPGAFFGEEGVTLGGGMITNSFDSRVEPYSSATASSRGNVRSNGNVEVSSAIVNGDATASGLVNVSNGSAVTGTLTDIGAQLLLVHDGHEYIKPVTAGGRFKLWLDGEMVEKYSLELAGIMVVDRKPVYVRQQSTTTIRDVGTTLVPVPPDARRRL